MIRVTPWDDPIAWGMSKRSSPSTRCPRRASCQQAALPMPPMPTTITSKAIAPPARVHGILARNRRLATGPRFGEEHMDDLSRRALLGGAATLALGAGLPGPLGNPLGA